MKNELKGNTTYKISKVMSKIKFRDFLKELKEEVKNIKKEEFTEIDQGFIFGDLILFITERLYLAAEEADELLQEVLGLSDEEIYELDHDTKVMELIDIFKSSIPKTLKQSLEAMGLKKNIISSLGSEKEEKSIKKKTQNLKK